MTHLIINQSNTLHLEGETTKEQQQDIKEMLENEQPISEIAQYLNGKVETTIIQVVQEKPISIEEILKTLDTIFA